MAEKLRFTNCELVKFAYGNKKTARFSCSLSNAVMEAMKWTEVPEWVTGGSLEGLLNASVMSLVPKQDSMKRHAMDLSISKIDRFQSVRLEIEGKRGKGHRQVLFFDVTISDEKGMRKLEELKSAVDVSTITVSYEPQPVQQDLPGVPPPMDDQPALEELVKQAAASGGCVSCANEIPMMADGSARHETGQPCTNVTASTLPRAAEMGAGRKRKEPVQ